MVKKLLPILSTIIATAAILFSLYNMNGYVAWIDLIAYTLGVCLLAVSIFINITKRY